MHYKMTIHGNFKSCVHSMSLCGAIDSKAHIRFTWNDIDLILNAITNILRDIQIIIDLVLFLYRFIADFHSL